MGTARPAIRDASLAHATHAVLDVIAHEPARAAIIGIVKQVGAGPAASGCSFNAPVLTPAGNTRAAFIGTGLGAADVAPAGSAETICFTPACVTRREAGALL